jgi:DNA integrity scanning protein DisA with diadenylate cyclase activity
MLHWVKDAIFASYQAQGKVPPEGVKAHSTRHASASWADLQGVLVLDICQQANWTTPYTFMKHYKLDLSNSMSAKHAQVILDVHDQ